MTKPIFIAYLIIWGLIFLQCAHSDIDPIIEQADYDQQSHTLHIDYSSNPDTSLLQIIALSNIRKSGYGLLLNIENSYTNSELDTLKLKFRRQDVNAIHSFNIFPSQALKRKVSVAMEGAAFIWILNRNNINIKLTDLGINLSAIQNKKEDRPLIVLKKD